MFTSQIGHLDPSELMIPSRAHSSQADPVLSIVCIYHIKCTMQGWPYKNHPKNNTNLKSFFNIFWWFLIKIIKNQRIHLKPPTPPKKNWAGF